MWQYPTDSLQGANLLALLAATRLYLPEEQYLLTVALPASRSVLGNIDLRRVSDYIDLLNLMPTHSHHAPLYPSSSSSSRDDGSSSSGAGCVSILLSQGFPSRKILLGTPTAGRGSPKSKSSRSSSSSSSSRSSSEDSDSVKQKATFVRQKGLGVSTIFFKPYETFLLMYACAITRVSFTGLVPQRPRTASEAWYQPVSALYTALDDLDIFRNFSIFSFYFFQISCYRQNSFYVYGRFLASGVLLR